MGAEIVFAPVRVDDLVRRRPDISVAAGVVGWQPEVAFREGIERTAAWFAATWARRRPPRLPVGPTR